MQKKNWRRKKKHSSRIHQNEVNRLKELKEKHADDFGIQLEKSYREGKIYLPELQDVLRE